jgi:hypothetical protein
MAFRSETLAEQERTNQLTDERAALLAEHAAL